MKKKINSLTVGVRAFVVYLILLLFSASGATGKSGKPLPEPKQPPAPQQDSQTNLTEDPVKDSDVTTFLNALEFFGRVEKPQTVFFIPGKDPKVDDIAIERKFFKEIFRRVEKNTLKASRKEETKTPFIPY
ncbi:hypothetical protein JXJ21_17710 [candidate division KSB1 bacterium]|nr:hypothetical protein [candidate division KSB1 bacterium]